MARELDNRMTGFHTSRRTKSIMDLALTAYLSENPDKNTFNGMNVTFRKFAMSQIKLFLFSGYDTTSSSVCYLFYVLTKNASVLARIRSEHDQILGSDITKAATLVNQRPSLLNQLPYTVAVIKETLGLYPVVSSTRAGEPDFNVIDETNRRFPTNGFLVWANPQVIQRDPVYWPQSDEFLPERWLVSQEDHLHPIKVAWRPFEFGPRNCIGQELAMLEMKIILVMTVRKFDIQPAYEELDRRDPKGKVKNVYGERGYQIGRSQPSDDFPHRVTIARDYL